jgi:Transketolase, N-terminal subunit
MPKTHQICRFIVKGVYPFPLDMLRYDSCWPAGPDDVSNIDRALNQYDGTERIVPPGGFEVRLCRAQEFAYPNSAPTIGRWRSFGWVITEIDGISLT